MISNPKQQFPNYQQSWPRNDKRDGQQWGGMSRTQAQPMSMSPMNNGSQSGNGTVLRAAGPISQLQEYVQSDWLHPVPSHRPILHWNFDNRMGHAMVLEFRAMVSFTLEGVLHHAAGSWQTSKKSAQRDAAQRVLWLAMDQWSGYSGKGGTPKAFNELRVNGEASAERTLELLIPSLPQPASVIGNHNKHQKPLHWRFSSDGKDGRNGSKTFQAIAEFEIFGVRHTFPGGFCGSKGEAKEDCARRILWYLKCPGYDSDFEVNSDSLNVSEPPPLPLESEWQRDGNAVDADVPNDAQRMIAEQKTLLMRVQNRLQKAYVQQLPPGASVWEWSYEFSADAKDIKLCRAWVKIHIADREFKGDWCRGQKKAQFDACERVQEFLDSLEGKNMEVENAAPQNALNWKD
jgi:hypothetical protein